MSIFLRKPESPLHIIFSGPLEIIGKIDTGQWLERTVLSPSLYTSVSLATWIWLGKMPVENARL